MSCWESRWACVARAKNASIAARQTMAQTRDLEPVDTFNQCNALGMPGGTTNVKVCFPSVPTHDVPRSLPMAVGAADLALEDLLEQAFLGILQHVGYFPELRTDVIELQDADIGLAAVAAGMSSQVPVQEGAILAANPLASRAQGLPMPVRRGLPLLVGARLAIGLQPVGPRSVPVESGLRLGPVATG